MSRVLKLTISLLLLFSVYLFIAGTVKDGPEGGIYYAAMGFGSLFFPVLIYVVLYHLFFRKRFNYSSLLLSFFIKSFALILISFGALFVWAILEFIVTSGFAIDLFLISVDFRDEYLDYMPAVIICALLIPVGYHVLKPGDQKN